MQNIQGAVHRKIYKTIQEAPQRQYRRGKKLYSWTGQPLWRWWRCKKCQRVFRKIHKTIQEEQQWPITRDKELYWWTGPPLWGWWRLWLFKFIPTNHWWIQNNHKALSGKTFPLFLQPYFSNLKHRFSLDFSLDNDGQQEDHCIMNYAVKEWVVLDFQRNSR